MTSYGTCCGTDKRLRPIKSHCHFDTPDAREGDGYTVRPSYKWVRSIPSEGSCMSDSKSVGRSSVIETDPTYRFSIRPIDRRTSLPDGMKG
jgi:hypothetical protein